MVGDCCGPVLVEEVGAIHEAHGVGKDVASGVRLEKWTKIYSEARKSNHGVRIAVHCQSDLDQCVEKPCEGSVVLTTSFQTLLHEIMANSQGLDSGDCASAHNVGKCLLEQGIFAVVGNFRVRENEAFLPDEPAQDIDKMIEKKSEPGRFQFDLIKRRWLQTFP